MQVIMDMSKSIRHNIEEARAHIDRAYEVRDVCRAVSDWYKTMALAHLDFNAAGHAAVKKAIEDYRAKGQRSDLQPGMMAVYEATHNDLIKQAAEVRYLIDNLPK